MPPAVATQLKRKGIDAVAVRDLGLLGGDDRDHLQLAGEQNRVLCTYDKDFIRLARQGIEHSGIVFIHNKHRDIGTLVSRLIQIRSGYSPDDMKNSLEYL